MLQRTNGAALISAVAGVPVPPARYRRSKYPWAEMGTGYSFIFPPDVTQNAASTAACNAGKRLGKRFIVRRVPADGTLRCWCLGPR
jgi:hypothetical protein